MIEKEVIKWKKKEQSEKRIDDIKIRINIAKTEKGQSKNDRNEKINCPPPSRIKNKFRKIYFGKKEKKEMMMMMIKSAKRMKRIRRVKMFKILKKLGTD